MKHTSVRFPVFAWLLAAAALWVLPGCQHPSDSTPPSGEAKQQMLPPPPPPPAPTPPTTQADSLRGAGVFTYVDTMPSFPGGEAALKRYLSAHIHYPASAREAGRQGTVVVQFLVKRDGSLDQIVTLGRRDSALAAEAMRVVRGMPRWNPGRHDGKTVVVQYSIPVRFVLQ